MLGICEKIIKQAIKDNIIESKDLEIYIFGLKTGVSFIINLFTVFMTASILKMFGEALVFSLAYYFLRSFAGGIHAKTAVRCYIYSLMLIIAALFFIKYINIPMNYLIVVMIFSVLIVYSMAPVPNANKPLDLVEQKYLKKITYKTLCCEIGLFGIGIISGFPYISKCIASAIFIIAILLMAGKIKYLYFIVRQ